jgi:flagellar assembly factor FliW
LNSSTKRVAQPAAGRQAGPLDQSDDGVAQPAAGRLAGPLDPTIHLPMAMSVIESSRFGTLRVDPVDVIEFPLGLIGLGGRHYTLLDRNPGSGFQWLHSLEDGGLALPVIDPRRFFHNFALELTAEERERIGAPDPAAAALYVTVRTAPDPADVIVNLRAPIVVWEGRGYQVLNTAPGAALQARLFAPADPPGTRSGGAIDSGAPAADAA